MRIAATISRYLLGFVFLVFGLNGFFHFIPQPPPTGLALQFFIAVSASHFIAAVFAVQTLSGALLLLNRYVPLAITMLAGVLFNILNFHITIMQGGLGLPLFVTALWLIVAVSVRSAFAGIFQAHVQPEFASAAERRPLEA
jgi:putative oxidoreductase